MRVGINIQLSEENERKILKEIESIHLVHQSVH